MEINSSKKARDNMTESEAIEKLKNMRLFMQIEDKNNDCKFTEDDYKANEMAIQALEKQIEMKKYCDENDCADCPYHNTSLKDNRCMNDFIIDKE